MWTLFENGVWLRHTVIGCGERKGSLERGRDEVGLDRTAHKFPCPTYRRDPVAHACHGGVQLTNAFVRLVRLNNRKHS
jgi:hypothetical protein